MLCQEKGAEQCLHPRAVTTRPRCPLCEPDAPGSRQDAADSIAPGRVSYHGSAAPSLSTCWRHFCEHHLYFLFKNVLFKSRNNAALSNEPIRKYYRKPLVSQFHCFPQTSPCQRHGDVGTVIFEKTVPSRLVNKAGSQKSELPGFVL